MAFGISIGRSMEPVTGHGWKKQIFSLVTSQAAPSEDGAEAAGDRAGIVSSWKRKTEL